MKVDRNYYLRNAKYSQFLDTQSISDFKVYVKTIIKLASNSSRILDVGCGTGIVVDYLAKHGYLSYGIEIANSSLKIARLKKGKYYSYDGDKLPFPDQSFDMVGSFNVVEHVNSVPDFLNEKLRIIKPKGYLIICAPNFLSITNSFHYRTQGLNRKFKNVVIIIRKRLSYAFTNVAKFETIKPTFRKDFHPDDDAINLINPIDLIKWGKEKRLELITYMGTSMPSSGIKKFLSGVPIIKFFFGSMLIVFQKS